MTFLSCGFPHSQKTAAVTFNFKAKTDCMKLASRCLNGEAFTFCNQDYSFSMLNISSARAGSKAQNLNHNVFGTLLSLLVGAINGYNQAKLA
jgi:hypothetical protein